MSQERQIQAALFAFVAVLAVVYYFRTREPSREEPASTPVAEADEEGEPDSAELPIPPRTQLAVYTQKDQGLAIAEKLVTDAGFVLQKSEDDPVPAAARSAFVKELALADYALPTEEAWPSTARTLTKEESTAANATTLAVVIDFYLREPRDGAAHLAMGKIIDALAVQLDGFAWDENTRELMAPKKWHELRVASFDGTRPSAIAQVNWHVYEVDDGYRIVSLGMNKFGLAEMSYVAGGKRYAKSLVNVFNAAAQRLVEGAKVAEDGTLPIALQRIENKGVREYLEDTKAEGAKGETTIAFQTGEREEGDNDAPLLDIVLRDGEARAIDDLFGGKRDPVSYEKADDPELLAARDRARAKISGDVKRWWLREKKVGDSLSVKAPFTTDDGAIEWMWLEVKTWKGTKIEGILQNEPEHVSTLELGAHVSADEAKLFDYLRERKNGKNDGNETGEILARRHLGHAEDDE